jgi:hypothetical protein
LITATVTTTASGSSLALVKEDNTGNFVDVGTIIVG